MNYQEFRDYTKCKSELEAYRYCMTILHSYADVCLKAASEDTTGHIVAEGLKKNLLNIDQHVDQIRETAEKAAKAAEYVFD